MTEETINDIEEEWKTISEWINYQVSNLGRVRNINTGRILKPGHNTSGYLYVALFHESNNKKQYVHRLVAQEFIDNPDTKQDVDHIDHTTSIKAHGNNVHPIIKAFIGIINHRNGLLKYTSIPKEYTLDFLSMRLMSHKLTMIMQNGFLVHLLIQIYYNYNYIVT